MQKKFLILASACIVMLASCDSFKSYKSPEIITPLDTLSAAAGIYVGDNFKRDIEVSFKDSSAIETIIKGFDDADQVDVNETMAFLAGLSAGETLTKSIYPNFVKLFSAKDSTLEFKNEEAFIDMFINEYQNKSSNSVIKNKADSILVAESKKLSSTFNKYLFFNFGIDTANTKYIDKAIYGLKSINAENIETERLYAVGVSISSSIHTEVIPSFNIRAFGNDSTQKLNNAIFVDQFRKALLSEQLLFSNAQLAKVYFDKVANATQEKELETEFGANKEAGKGFLDANKSAEGVKTTESGLQYKVIKEGTGAKPKVTDKVKVHYTGTLVDGTKFDSSVDRGTPATFGLNQVIKGWTEGLQLMPAGSKYMLYIPYELGYGAANQGKIKPFSTLIFEVELIEIVK